MAVHVFPQIAHLGLSTQQLMHLMLLKDAKHVQQEPSPRAKMQLLALHAQQAHGPRDLIQINLTILDFPNATLLCAIKVKAILQTMLPVQQRVVKHAQQDSYQMDLSALDQMITKETISDQVFIGLYGACSLVF